MNKLILSTVTALILMGTSPLFAQESEKATKEMKEDKKDKKKKKDKKMKKGEEDKATISENLKDSASYCMGSLIAQNIKQQGVQELNYELFLKAMQDVLEGNEMSIPSEENQKIVSEYMQEQKKVAYASTIKKGEEFLAENGKRKEVVTLPSGLQYEVIKMGDGPVPVAANTVKTHYVGTLIDGTKFDSSVDRGQPASFPLTRVIKGWTEALQLMPVGSKWKLYVPYDLAYGANPQPGSKIQPYDVLIFEIELISIEQ